MKTRQNSFEQSLGELEKITEQLEMGELSLADSMEMYENGMNLSQECKKILDSVEKKLELLEKQQGNWEEKKIIFDIEKKNKKKINSDFTSEQDKLFDKVNQ